MGEKVKVKFRGATFEVDEDRIPALLVQLGIGPFKAKEAGIAKGSRIDHKETLVVALKAVIESPDGIVSQDLAAILGVRGPRGMSSVTVVWRRLLRKAGVDFDEAFSQTRDAYVRYWHAGKRAKEALKLVEKMRSAGAKHLAT